MTDTTAKRRCPNCAWAIKQADRMQLPFGESWVFVVLAEHVDGLSLQRHFTQGELSRLTRMNAATVGRHVKALVTRGCIHIERTREGYHYHLLRDAAVPAVDVPKAKPKPVVRPTMPWDEPEAVADQELRNSKIMTVENRRSENAGSAENEDPDLRNSKLPLMKSPLEEPLRKKEPSLRSGLTRAQAPATPEKAGSNVVVLSAKAESAQAIEAWNLMAQRCDLPRVMRPGESAMRRLGAQIRRHGIEDVLRAIEAVGASPWCTGVNDSGWRADFYFLLQAQSFDRLLSGFYAAREGCARVRPGTHAAFQRKYGLGAMQPVFDPEPEGAERLAQ